MKPCPECRTDGLHDDAIVCPHCRAPLTREGRWLRTVERISRVLIGLFLVSFLLLLAGCGVMFLL